MPKKQERTKHTTCLICEHNTKDGKALTFHIKTNHGLKAEDYTAQHVYKGRRPLCPVCNSNTRYVAFTFKKYCKEHSSYGEAEGGSVGGTVKKTWNKGQTKLTDERILIQHFHVN